MSIFVQNMTEMSMVASNADAMFLNTQADQLYEIHSEVKKKITRIMTKRNRFMEEFEKRKFIDFHLKYSTLTRNVKPTT